MKTRNGFISNSSSSSFIITNTSDEPKTLVDFVKENPQLVEEFCKEYDWNNITQEQMITSARHADPRKFPPGEAVEAIFGDEQGTIVGQVFDYILRDGGQSESFTWRFHEHLR